MNNNLNNEEQPIPVHQVTPEELQKTQVLNIQEVEDVVKIEKKFSKKPILLIAITGFAFIILGSSFQLLSINKEKTPTSSVIEKRKVVETVKTEELTCAKTTLNNPDGTDIVYSIKYSFTNNKLSSYIKTYTVTQTAGNESGKQTVSDASNKYKDYLNSTDGYTVSLTTSENGYILMNTVDFKELDLTKVNNKQSENIVTNIEYNKNAEKTEVRSKSLKEGFTCN